MKQLKKSDIIRINEGHRVYYSIPERHSPFGCRKVLIHRDVVVGNKCDGINTDFLKGEYVVTKTVVEGGGCGHGPYDIYPDGHHVFCTKIDDPSISIDFYQSGCFTAMITDIRPIGRMKEDDPVLSASTLKRVEAHKKKLGARIKVWSLDAIIKSFFVAGFEAGKVSAGRGKK